MPQTDFLVIGTGLAGLSFAVKTAMHHPDREVVLISKSRVTESNTRYAQGGIAVVTDFSNDDFGKHKEDTLKAGDGLCNPHIVDLVVREGPARIEEMIDLGAEFDRTPEGNYHLGIEGAHSVHRILHFKDVTGLKIQETLLKRARSLPNIHILEHHFAVELITGHHLHEEPAAGEGITCYGAYVLDLRTLRVFPFAARITLLAAGGIGQVYKVTTNPEVATGDGIAMAARAGAEIEHMQFVQFHPTALYGRSEGRSFLISEAVRGFGAVLRNGAGESFMEKYDERGSLASRDIVARSIDTEMKQRGEECVWLDCRHLDTEEFREHFPNIYQKCCSEGIDVARQMIPVAPAAHYLCGGVKTDEWGRTGISQLYCCGEVASTGLHGANRLASNSLLEALVFAHRCFLDAMERIDTLPIRKDLPSWRSDGTTRPREWILIHHTRNELKSIMHNYVGIVRSDERLARSLKRLETLWYETEELYRRTTLSPQLCELRNMIQVARLIVEMSVAQKENRGTYYNVDNDL